MSKKETINSPEELKKFISDRDIKDLLLGNGFGLSHPDLKESFKFSDEEVDEELKKLSKGKKEKISCPEDYLGNYRLALSRVIIEKYVEKLTDETDKSLFDSYNEKKYNCIRFLNSFKKIHTLNYDPLLYFEILKLFYSSIKLPFCDGFDGDTPTEQKEVMKRLFNRENHKPFMYLHGSYFIICNSENKISKILRYDLTLSKIKRYLCGGDPRIFLILEDRSETKMALINNNEYFEQCYTFLKESEDNILVFGASFKNDNHIIEALSERKNKNIFITYYGDGRKEIEKKINKINENLIRKITWVKLEQENLIWNNAPTDYSIRQALIDNAISTGIENFECSISESVDGNISKYMADLEDTFPLELEESISHIKQSCFFEELEKNINLLYYHCIIESIINTDIMDDFHEKDFDLFKDLLISSLSCFKDHIINKQIEWQA